MATEMLGQLLEMLSSSNETRMRLAEAFYINDLSAQSVTSLGMYTLKFIIEKFFKRCPADLIIETIIKQII